MPHYKTEELLEQALGLIDRHKLFFVSDVITLLGLASSTFYTHFPSDSPQYAKIDDAIRQQRVSVKVTLRNKWFKSDNATLQMGLMKLVGTDEERRILSQTHTDITSGGDKVDNVMRVEVADYSNDNPPE